MTKPLHAGRAAESGVTAALLARDGFTAARNILEAQRGFYNAMAGGYDENKKVRDQKVVDLMKRVTLYVDDELEALGYDQVRSRIRIKLKDGRIIEGRYDVARGHPAKPMSWDELGEKFRACADLVLPSAKADEAIHIVGQLETLRSLTPLLRALSDGDGDRDPKGRTKAGKKRWSRTRKR